MKVGCQRSVALRSSGSQPGTLLLELQTPFEMADRAGFAPASPFGELRFKLSAANHRPTVHENPPALGVAPSSNCLTGNLHTPCIDWYGGYDECCPRFVSRSTVGHPCCWISYPGKWCARSVMLRRWTEGHRGYSPVVLFRRLLTREMVDRHGFAPCSPACEASDLLNDRAAQENGSGSRIRTGAWRLMRPLPCRLAIPQSWKIGTASRCCPEPVRFWRPNCARWRPPCKFM